MFNKLESIIDQRGNIVLFRAGLSSSLLTEVPHLGNRICVPDDSHPHIQDTPARLG